jgi:hypothetical protein
MAEKVSTMNLYVIRRSPDHFVSDKYAYAIVAAESGDAAKHTHPDKGVVWKNQRWTKGGRDYGSELWADPQKVRPKLLGIAKLGIKAGPICTSFNEAR